MKNLLIICLALFATTTFAQRSSQDEKGPRSEMREKMKDLTPQQRAELKTKKMTLHLDLNESQQASIQKLNMEQELRRENFRKEREKKEAKNTNDNFDRRTAALDEKIATKKELQSILTPEQFEKFEKMNKRRGRGKRKASKKQNHN